jgi:hypothetical protein
MNDYLNKILRNLNNTFRKDFFTAAVDRLVPGDQNTDLKVSSWLNDHRNLFELRHIENLILLNSSIELSLGGNSSNTEDKITEICLKLLIPPESAGPVKPKLEEMTESKQKINLIRSLQLFTDPKQSLIEDLIFLYKGKTHDQSFGIYYDVAFYRNEEVIRNVAAFIRMCEKVVSVHPNEIQKFFINAKHLQEFCNLPKEERNAVLTQARPLLKKTDDGNVMINIILAAQKAGVDFRQTLLELQDNLHDCHKHILEEKLCRFLPCEQPVGDKLSLWLNVNQMHFEPRDEGLLFSMEDAVKRQKQVQRSILSTLLPSGFNAGLALFEKCKDFNQKYLINDALKTMNPESRAVSIQRLAPYLQRLDNAGIIARLLQMAPSFPCDQMFGQLVELLIRAPTMLQKDVIVKTLLNTPDDQQDAAKSIAEAIDNNFSALRRCMELLIPEPERDGIKTLIPELFRSLKSHEKRNLILEISRMPKNKRAGKIEELARTSKLIAEWAQRKYIHPRIDVFHKTLAILQTMGQDERNRFLDSFKYITDIRDLIYALKIYKNVHSTQNQINRKLIDFIRPVINQHHLNAAALLLEHVNINEIDTKNLNLEKLGLLYTYLGQIGKEETAARLANAAHGLIEEFLARKDLAHRFAIEGSFTLDKAEYFYEGYYSMRTYQELARSLREYLRENSEKIKLTEKQQHELFDSFNMVNARLDAQEQYHKYLQGQPVVISTGWKRHATSYVLKGSALVKLNKGARKLRTTISVYEIKNTEKITAEYIQSLTALTHYSSTQHQDMLYFKYDIDRELGLTFLNEESLETPEQKVGNCTWATPKLAARAILYLMYREKHSIEQSKQMAQNVFKDWRSFDLERGLKNYLDSHAEGKPLHELTDEKLLKNIHEKCERKQSPAYQKIQDMLQPGPLSIPYENSEFRQRRLRSPLTPRKRKRISSDKNS